ncbi:hypothetical protein NPIL_95311 [Nephila pilipes]|uniref:Uncharacterized protein n=1 Tax=Nephila pilipes TaxID=299642 RepID=A0A8X6P4D9_NEPPI|nr:hypothetical protein NPIL_95311 [Nephila pilipes]
MTRTRSDHGMYQLVPKLMIPITRNGGRSTIAAGLETVSTSTRHSMSPICRWRTEGDHLRHDPVLIQSSTSIEPAPLQT